VVIAAVNLDHTGCGNITYTAAPGALPVAPMSDCNLRCSDDPFETCGGVNRLQLYKGALA
jgi:hypothetical protein